MMNNQDADLNLSRVALKRPLQPGENPFAETLATGALWLLMLSGVVAEVLGQTYLVSFGFYTLHVVDPAVLLIFCAWGVYQISRPPQGGLIVIPVCMIAALVVVNFIRGLGVDTNAALLNGRANLAVAGFLMLGLTCVQSPKIHRAMRNSLLFSATLIAGLSVLRQLFGPALFMTFSVTDINEINDGGRALSSSGAFIIALGATMLLSDLLRARSSRLSVKVIWFFVLVSSEVLSRQGTATLAMVAMISVLILLERGPFYALRILIFVPTAAILLFIVLTGGIESLLGYNGGGFDFAQRSNNLDTRITIWDAFMKGFEQEPLFNQLFGMAAGQRPAVIVFLHNNLYDWQLSTHSMYYGSLLVMGYVGLYSYIILLTILIVGLLLGVLRRRSEVSPAYPLAMCIGTAVLSFSYEVRTASLFGIFASIWWYRSNRQRTRTAGLPARIAVPARRLITRSSSTS